MRTSLIEIKEIDDHLMGLAAPGDNLVFNAKTIINDELREKVLLQQHTYTLVHHYGRKQLKAEIEAVHQQLFNTPTPHGFVKKILALFKK
ncbi:hypothetical protein [Mucilaginibacter agri]|uniref:Uncharacterized protein n=1 Tax=Mucilaginibacter agri TaxID=2695265 RepID=A0A965ZI72_9SPHI|nr:hypothetical protein [Mucilaginibacter agri]NCD71165.1 hypothetical protein [Mucilaginibacter agri]